MPRRPVDRTTSGEAAGPEGAGGARVPLARVERAHGVRGAVRCRLYGDSAAGWEQLGRIELPDGRTGRVRVLAADRRHALCQLEGVEDRTAAAGLVGGELAIPRGRLPAAEHGTYYHVDLIGLAVHDLQGRSRGRVAAVHNFGAGDLLEIRLTAGAPVLVPFTRAAVPAVDLDGGLLRIDPVWLAADPGRPAAAGQGPDDGP